jgi:hypothetical protein
MGVMTFLDATLVQALIVNYGYAAVFVVVLLESSGIPLPGETILVCASVYAGTRHGLDIRVIIGSAACGAILGDNVGFWVGTPRFSRESTGLDRSTLPSITLRAAWSGRMHSDSAATFSARIFSILSAPSDGWHWAHSQWAVT